MSKDFVTVATHRRAFPKRKFADGGVNANSGDNWEAERRRELYGFDPGSVEMRGINSAEMAAPLAVPNTIPSPSPVPMVSARGSASRAAPDSSVTPASPTLAQSGSVGPPVNPTANASVGGGGSNSPAAPKPIDWKQIAQNAMATKQPATPTNQLASIAGGALGTYLKNRNTQKDALTSADQGQVASPGALVRRRGTAGEDSIADNTGGGGEVEPNLSRPAGMAGRNLDSGVDLSGVDLSDLAPEWGPDMAGGFAKGGEVSPSQGMNQRRTRPMRPSTPTPAPAPAAPPTGSSLQGLPAGAGPGGPPPGGPPPRTPQEVNAAIRGFMPGWTGPGAPSMTGPAAGGPPPGPGPSFGAMPPGGGSPPAAMGMGPGGPSNAQLAAASAPPPSMGAQLGPMAGPPPSGPPPAGPPPGGASLGPMAGPPPGGPPPGGPPPAGPPAQSFGAMAPGAVNPQAAQQAAMQAAIAQQQAQLGRPPGMKKGGAVEDADGNSLRAKTSRDRQWGDVGKAAEDLPPEKKAKGGKVKHKAPFGKGAPPKKKVVRPPVPMVTDEDMDLNDGMPTQAAGPAAPPPGPPPGPPPAGPPPGMNKGGKCDKMAKGGGVEEKGKTKGKAVKMAAGGVAKLRRGFPHTIKKPSKKFAKGGSVRGCGIATKGKNFSGVY